MTYVPVVNMDYPTSIQAGGSFNSAASTINATGHKYAWIGSVRWNDRSDTSKDIRSLSFPFGSVVKAGGSGLTVSVQALDAANGPPGRPDGTPIQSVAIANGNASFASNTYITTGNLGADVTVNYGDRIAVVVEFDGSGRLGSDSVAIAHANGFSMSDGPSLLTASWAAVTAFNSIVLNFADGSVGVLEPAIPMSSSTVGFAINTGTNPDEIALKFTPDFKCKIDGIWAGMTTATDGSFDLILYQGTTALRTVSFDYNTLRTASYHCVVAEFAELELTPATAYYVAIKPTSANSVTMRGYTVSSSGVMALASGAGTTQWAQRVDAGSWDESLTTRRPLMGVRISAIDDGAGGGGSGLAANPLGGFIG